MKAYFYKFSKKINSTKVPVFSGTEKEIFFKDPVNLLQPRIVYSGENFNFNYAEIGGRFYFVDSITIAKNTLYEVELSLDSLASYRKDILDTSQLVVRSASSYNLNIIDTMPTNCEKKVKVSETETKTFSENGVYVVNVAGIGNGGNVNGFTKAYGMSSENLQALSQALYTLDDDALEILQRTFTSPYNSISSVFWIPLNVSHFGGGDEAISLGNYVTDVNGEVLVSRNHSEKITISYDRIYNDFREITCVKKTLYLPYVGLIPLDSSEFYGCSSIEIEIESDILSGGVIYKISALYENDRQLISIINANTALSIPIAQTRELGVANTLTSFIGKNLGTLVSGISGLLNRSYATLNDYYSNYTAMINSVGLEENVDLQSIYRGGTPTAQGSFSSNAMSLLGNSILLYTEYNNISDDPLNYNEKIGLPLNKKVALKNLTGYTQCSNVAIDLDCEKKVHDMIIRIMQGGFYIE